MEKKESKFPDLGHDKTYGFAPGTYEVPYGTSPPPKGQEGYGRLYNQEGGANWYSYYDTFDGGSPSVRHWFFFDGQWIEMDWDKMQDPTELRRRREYNEELQKHKRA